MERFRTLTQIPGLSAHEMRVRDYMKKELSRHSAELVYDGLGSVFAVKKSGKPGAPRLMMSGHMDEVGFIVKQITPKGLIKFFPIGRTWEHVIMAQRVTVYSSLTGQGWPGAVASIPPHLLPEDGAKRLLTIDQMLIDIGAESREEVLASGIRPGDMIIVDGLFQPLFGGKKLLAKAWDNRFGCGGRGWRPEVRDQIRDSEVNLMADCRDNRDARAGNGPGEFFFIKGRQIFQRATPSTDDDHIIFSSCVAEGDGLDNIFHGPGPLYSYRDNLHGNSGKSFLGHEEEIMYRCPGWRGDEGDFSW